MATATSSESESRSWPGPASACRESVARRGRPPGSQGPPRTWQVRPVGRLRRSTRRPVWYRQRHPEEPRWAGRGDPGAARGPQRRGGAVKARTQASNQLKALLTTAPAELREHLRHLNTSALIATYARLRPAVELADPAQATKTALRRLARRHQQLSEEITEADTDLRGLVTAAAPGVLALPCVGIEVAGQLLTTAGDNPDRLHSEAAFAHLCGVAPIPASSGRTHRHRLNRGGDRATNNALYIVVVGRLRYGPRTRAYADRRTKEGLSKPEIIRCLKRYVAREVFTALAAPAVQDPVPTTSTMSTAT